MPTLAGGRPHAASQAGNHGLPLRLERNQAGWNATDSYQNRRDDLEQKGKAAQRTTGGARRAYSSLRVKVRRGLRTIVENDHSPAFHGLHVKRIARAEPLPKPHRERHGRGPKPPRALSRNRPADDAVHLDVGQKIGALGTVVATGSGSGACGARGHLYFGLGRFEKSEQVPPGLTPVPRFRAGELRQPFRVEDFPRSVRGRTGLPRYRAAIGSGRKHRRDRVCRVIAAAR